MSEMRLQDCYTLRQAARRLRCSTDTVRLWALAGRLPGARMVLGRWVVPVGALRRAPRPARVGRRAARRGRATPA